MARQLNAVPMYSAVQPRQLQPECGLSASQHQRQSAHRQLLPAAGRAWARCAPSIIAGNASYNSLQVTVRRNFTRRLSYGLAYTWSKTMSAFGSTANGTLHQHPEPLLPRQVPQLRTFLSAHAARARGQLHLRRAEPRAEVQPQAARLGYGPLDHLRHHPVAQRYPRRRPRHLLLRDHFHQPANELDRRVRRRQDAGRRQPATSFRPGVVRRQHAAGAGPRSQCQRHARQSAPQRNRLRDSEPVQLDARARLRSRASDNPCRASATPAPAA